MMQTREIKRDTKKMLTTKNEDEMKDANNKVWRWDERWKKFIKEWKRMKGRLIKMADKPTFTVVTLKGIGKPRMTKFTTDMRWCETKYTWQTRDDARLYQRNLGQNHPCAAEDITWLNFITQSLRAFVFPLSQVTPSGCPFDRIIQTGVDNPGHPFIMTVGCVAGDEESYEVFADLLDPVIDGRHNGYGKDAKHKTDLNPDNLKVSQNRLVTNGKELHGFY